MNDINKNDLQTEFQNLIINKGIVVATKEIKNIIRQMNLTTEQLVKLYNRMNNQN